MRRGQTAELGTELRKPELLDAPTPSILGGGLSKLHDRFAIMCPGATSDY